MVIFLLACGDSIVSVTPDPPLERSLRELRIAVGRARETPERACEAVERAVRLAPRVREEVGRGEVPAEHLGLRIDGLRVRPDWVELAMAAGEGPLATALVTLGGLDELERASCVRSQVLERWTRRLPTVARGLPCAAETVRRSAVTTLRALRDRCPCEPIEPSLGARLAARVWPLDPTLADRFVDWGDDPSCGTP